MQERMTILVRQLCFAGFLRRPLQSLPYLIRGPVKVAGTVFLPLCMCMKPRHAFKISFGKSETQAVL